MFEIFHNKKFSKQMEEIQRKMKLATFTQQQDNKYIS